MAASYTTNGWQIPQLPIDALRGPEPQTTAAAASDEVLVEAAKRGDADAFERLIERHQRFCFSKAYSILRNRADAEDEVQNAWAKAWERLWQYQGEGSFAGWLGRIVSNHCLMRFRDRKGARMISVDEVFDGEGSFHLEVIDQSALPEELLGDTEVSSVLNHEIRRIPPLLRKALVMRDLHQLCMRDIAAELGISVPAAKSRLMRARIELKQRLAKHQGLNGCGTLMQKSSRRQAAYVRAM